MVDTGASLSPIVVTATGRECRAADVSASISIQGAEFMKGFNVEDTLEMTLGLSPILFCKKPPPEYAFVIRVSPPWPLSIFPGGALCRRQGTSFAFYAKNSPCSMWSGMKCCKNLGNQLSQKDSRLPESQVRKRIFYSITFIIIKRILKMKKIVIIPMLLLICTLCTPVFAADNGTPEIADLTHG